MRRPLLSQVLVSTGCSLPQPPFRPLWQLSSSKGRDRSFHAAAAMRGKMLMRLGLSASADAAAIRERYRQLAKAHHPDVNPGPHSSEQFKLLSEAYQYLLSAEPDDGTEPRRRDGNADRAEGPAMEARWNVRRRMQASEYPAWFKPDDHAQPEGEEASDNSSKKESGDG